MSISVAGPSPSSSAARFLISVLDSFASLTVEEIKLVQACCTRQREHAAGAPLTGNRRPYAHFVISGWIGRVRALADGRRQVLTTALPGEFIGRHPNPLIDSMTIALTNAITLDIGPLLEALEKDEAAAYGNLSLALVQVQHREQAQLAEQVVRLGRRTASERLCHWLLETHQRLERAGLVKLDSFPMPLSQDLMADILGLSVVHVNRVIQQLRRAGYLELARGSATLRQLRRLRAMTEFEQNDWTADEAQGWRASA
jgi:CRP-like cAMP-binding protein